jgi:hypothetical protein
MARPDRENIKLDRFDVGRIIIAHKEVSVLVVKGSFCWRMKDEHPDVMKHGIGEMITPASNKCQ